MIFKPQVRGIAVVILCFAFTGSLRLQSQGFQRQPRIGRIDERSIVRLPNTTHSAIRAGARDDGSVPADQPMDRVLLMLKSSPEQETALEELLSQQQDPSSPNYHRWLTPGEFGDRFGATAEEIAIVSNWLGSHGFTVTNVAKSRRQIEFKG